MSSPVLTCPHSSSPVLTCSHLSSPVLTCLSCPHLSSPVLSHPLPSSPVLSCPLPSSPVLTCPLPSSPVLTCPHLSSTVLTCPHLSSCRWSTLRSLTGLSTSCPSCPSAALCLRTSPTLHLTTTPVSSGATSCRGTDSSRRHFESMMSYLKTMTRNVLNERLCVQRWERRNAQWKFCDMTFDPVSVRRFLGSDDRDTFFKTTQRHQVVSSQG